VVLSTAVAAHTAVADAGIAVIVSGGTPTKGATQPTWATTSLVPAAVWPYPSSVLTVDGTALWINRSNPNATQAAGIFNWGIKPYTGILGTVSPNVGSGAWASNTFYSLDSVLIDSNGNLQSVTTPGTGGATQPVWATSVGLTTAAVGGTAIWTMIQTKASLTWAPETVYCPEHVDVNGNRVFGTGQYIVANAGGTPCLFQLQPSIQPQIVQQGTTHQTNMAAATMLIFGTTQAMETLVFSNQCPRLLAAHRRPRP